jgi:hypothetical protein
MEGNEKSTLLGKAMHVGERLAELGGKAARLKTAASHAVEDAVTEAKRLAKRGCYAAEDVMEDATHWVKRIRYVQWPSAWRSVSAWGCWLYAWQRATPESSQKRRRAYCVL